MPNIPSPMQAVVITGKGGPDVLQLREVATPRPGARDVLIAVKAAGVNRPDVLQRKGLYPAPKDHSALPGLEVSGVVAEVGAECTRFKVGDAVLALVNGGGYSPYCVASEDSTLAKPDLLTWVEAAAIPETFFTVWHNVFERGGLKSGEKFLIHGGTSGIGVTAIQMAKAFGATVFATAGSADKCAACLGLGADRAIDYTQDNFADVIKAETGGRGVDVILDMVGGDYIERNIRSLADDGRLVNIAYQKGSSATIDFMRVMLKRLTITGSTLRVRSRETKAGIAQNVEQIVLPLVVAGHIKIPIDGTFPLAAAADAHRRMESGLHIGKIVLTIG
ncbi:MAG: NAD(P)H-quinone oxidoreductase [Hyphomicrobium sp.]